MPTITAKVSDELLAYIDLVSGGNRSEYLRRCLEAGPGDLESGLKIVTNQLSGHCCKVSDEAVLSYSKALHFKNSAYQAHFARGSP